MSVCVCMCVLELERSYKQVRKAFHRTIYCLQADTLTWIGCIMQPGHHTLITHTCTHVHIICTYIHSHIVHARTCIYTLYAPHKCLSSLCMHRQYNSQVPIIHYVCTDNTSQVPILLYVRTDNTPPKCLSSSHNTMYTQTTHLTPYAPAASEQVK